MRKNIVVVGALILTLLLVLAGVIIPETLSEASEYLLYTFISENFGWYYMLAALTFVVVCLFAALSKYGSIRLGKNSDKPEFNLFTWIAMLYSAGLAISLFFFGVAEPVFMYMDPPFGEGGTKESAELAMRWTFFHWGFHSWGSYAVIGLIMAYFQYRKNTPPLVSHTLQPLIGDKAYGVVGKVVNIIAIFAVISGISTSLGLGVKQIGAGLDYVYGINNTIPNQIILILILTAMFIASAYSGIQRGIKWLSNINIVLALTIMFFIFFSGPTRNILEIFTKSVGGYLQNFVSMSFHMEPFLNDYTWQAGWDFFYWGWAISFGVFVGLFIARISKGRTIREFIFGAMIIPTLATFVWYSTIGGSALYNIINLGNNELLSRILENMDTALFYFLQLYPFSPLLIAMTFVSLTIFFVTSADSTVYVLGMYSEETMEPSDKSKIIWGLVIAGVAIALSLSGGLTPIQTVSAVAGLPFSVVVLLMCWSFFKSLRADMAEEVDMAEEINTAEEIDIEEEVEATKEFIDEDKRVASSSFYS